MDKLLKNRLSIEFGPEVAAQFDMKKYVEILSKDYNDDPIFVVSID
jgi:hypothetical protein